MLSCLFVSPRCLFWLTLVLLLPLGLVRFLLTAIIEGRNSRVWLAHKHVLLSLRLTLREYCDRAVWVFVSSG